MTLRGCLAHRNLPVTAEEAAASLRDRESMPGPSGFSASREQPTMSSKITEQGGQQAVSIPAADVRGVMYVGA